MNLELKLAEKPSELLEILKIQEANHIDNLSPESVNGHGFLTVKHTYEMIEAMNSKAGQVIAKVNDEVVGYALVMSKEFKHLVPVLVPMFDTFEKVSYHGKRLDELNYYVMGQICVREDFKRQGIFKKLYEKHREVYANRFDYCLTEVSSRNIPSILAHEKVGFKTIHTFSDPIDEWHILLWDWT